MLMNIVRSLFGNAVTDAGIPATGTSEARSAYDFALTSLDGAPMPLAQFQGKALLVVNTASRCGFTRQYAGLQVLWKRYRDRGLVVIGVPSNDFGAQEPGSESEIKEFCELTFGIDFPMSGKERVSGKNAHPFYAWAAQQLGLGAKPRWNFHKYLVNADGRLVDWFSTMTPPTSPRLAQAIEAALPAVPDATAGQARISR
jgi:glutathione peroxidase